MAYKDFINDFRKDILKDVLFFYGAEDYLMEWAVSQIISRYVDDEWRSIDVKHIDGSSCSAYEIMGEARAYSMFSDKRVIVVRNYLPLYRKNSDAGSDELLDFAAGSQGSSVLVFLLESRFSGDMTAFGKKMLKAAGSYDFARLERADLKAFISKRIQAGKKLIARREMEFLIDVTGYYNRDSSYTLTQLDSDLSKIVRACAGDEVTRDIIEDLLTGDEDRYVFNLVDALVSGSLARALEITETIIREEDGAMPVTALLTKQFEIMYDAIELNEKGYSISQMAKKTGINEFRFKRAFNAAGRYSKRRIGKILTDLYNTDRDIKSGNIDNDVALELIAISACA